MKSSSDTLALRGQSQRSARLVVLLSAKINPITTFEIWWLKYFENGEEKIAKDFENGEEKIAKY